MAYHNNPIFCEEIRGSRSLCVPLMLLPQTSDVKSFTEVYWNGLFILYYTAETERRENSETRNCRSHIKAEFERSSMLAHLLDYT
jgi:hypothetical protein